ncbi:MAG: hypothetical protein ACI4E3_02870 [Candidatus Fimousia sp.]|nr:hypothetical protein [Anaerostipes sp. 992a]MDD5968853.1 hypothetical protein [Anaerostipes sp.]
MILFLAGTVLGGILGIIITCLCVMAGKENDDLQQEKWLKQNNK